MSGMRGSAFPPNRDREKVRKNLLDVEMSPGRSAFPRLHHLPAICRAFDPETGEFKERQELNQKGFIWN